MKYSAKSKKVRYVDMAIWIDNNVYSGDFDSVMLYDYLYHLSKMLAYKRGLCSTSREYDDFSMYCASKYYFRLTNPKQFAEEDSLPKIKSILNYMKRTLYTTKIDFDREHKSDSIEDVIDYGEQFHQVLSNSVNSIAITEFKCYLNDVKRTVRSFLLKIPYKKGEWQNIYVSCLLSLLNSMTLSRKAIAKVSHLEKTARLRPDIVDKLYKNERKNSTILYHLPENMRDYITVLVNSLRKVIANDLSSIIHEDISPETYTKSMIIKSLGAKENDN